MSKNWRVSKALDKLLAQVNALYPKRRKDSDGSIGNAEHSARESDHNPNDHDVVDARDITHDPASGCDSYALAEALIVSKDPRIKYVISNGRIASGAKGPSPWKWRKYSGANKHDHHCHISVLEAKEDDTSAWDLSGMTATVGSPAQVAAAEAYVAPPRTLKRGNTGDAVKVLQKWLGFKGKDIDGKFGADTEKALREKQASLKITVDGKCGPQVWGLINS